MAYKIISPRLVIKPFASADITDRYLDWLNDKELMRYSRQQFRVHTHESCEYYRQSFENSPHFFWNVVRLEDAQQVGTVTAYVNQTNQVADVGLLVGCQGKGYGNEVFGAVMTCLFVGPQVRKVTAGTISTNQAMTKIAQHWGMLLEGTLREEERIGDTYLDVCCFGILRSEWMALDSPHQVTLETCS